MLRGLTFLPADSSAAWLGDGLPLVDTAAARRFRARIGRPALPPEDASTGRRGSLLEWVGCPAGYLAWRAAKRARDSLASRCKFR